MKLHGRELKVDPVFVGVHPADPTVPSVECTMSAVAAALNDGRIVTVALEPGDCTRYELMLDGSVGKGCFRVKRGGLGNRCVDRSAFVAVEDDSYDIRPICNGNQWTEIFLRAWIDELREEMHR